jgi:hypothetical protein
VVKKMTQFATTDLNAFRVAANPDL